MNEAMKKQSKIFLTFFLSILIIAGCKKDSSNQTTTNTTTTTTDYATLLPGIWKVKHFLKEELDNAGNVVKRDTLQYTDITANPIKVSESYSSNNRFYQMKEDYSDTLESGDYILSNNRINIQPSDANYYFKERTILSIDNHNMTVYQRFDNANPKFKLIHICIK
ncbi:MAG: hypothetical protein WC760_03695 [Bacteroidia bacterium]|jgi:hypothetical protein